MTDTHDDGARRVLVVANEAVEGPELTGALLDHLSGQTVRVCLITPALVESGLDHEMGQVDEAMGPARERLQRSLAGLHEAGIEAIGEVADADPLVAISDELQKFGADEIVLISHDEAGGAYAERNLRARAHHEFDQPITQLLVTRPELAGDGASGSRAAGADGPVAPGADAPHLLGVEHEGAGAGKHTADLRFSRNYPPLRARDMAAIVVGIFGSLLLAIIAADCALGDDAGGVTGACAAKLLIALGAFLINGAHVVALIFFQSLRYEGVLERFAATFTIAGTSLAVVVSLAL